MKPIEVEKAEAVRQAEQILHENYLRRSQRLSWRALPYKREAVLSLIGIATGFLIGGISVATYSHWDQIKDNIAGVGASLSYIFGSSYGIYKWVLRDALLGYPSR